MEIMRLVVTGCVGAGKTTFIRSISEIDVVDTDRKATDEVAQLKQNTTVSMDFGRVQFGADMALQIYGTPGQTRFDFMWDILIRRAHAYILLVAANRPSEFHQARRIMSFMDKRVEIPTIVGITHLDCEGAWTIDNIAVALGFPDADDRPIFVAVNPCQQESVAKTLIVLVQLCMERSVELITI
jgi:signal recognition particle receptor subunit beta